MNTKSKIDKLLGKSISNNSLLEEGKWKLPLWVDLRNSTQESRVHLVQLLNANNAKSFRLGYRAIRIDSFDSDAWDEIQDAVVGTNSLTIETPTWLKDSDLRLTNRNIICKFLNDSNFDFDIFGEKATLNDIYWSNSLQVWDFSPDFEDEESIYVSLSGKYIFAASDNTEGVRDETTDSVDIEYALIHIDDFGRNNKLGSHHHFIINNEAILHEIRNAIYIDDTLADIYSSLKLEISKL